MCQVISLVPPLFSSGADSHNQATVIHSLATLNWQWFVALCLAGVNVVKILL